MVDFTINASTFGSFYQNVGNNGTDDNVVVNIGTGFSGAITVDSQQADFEIETLVINVPVGWSVVLTYGPELAGENPTYKAYSYNVVNDLGTVSGVMSIRANDISTGVPCFCRGTQIATPFGELPVESLKVGDLVNTIDHGIQKVRWIGAKIVSSLQLEQQQNLAPIRIRAGALGSNIPKHDLFVSPQHRILVRSRIVGRMFAGEKDVLVAAKHLVLVEGVDITCDLNEVEYFHIMFDHHEIIFANGVETESMYAGQEALRVFSVEAREEIFTLFPELADMNYEPAACRQFCDGHSGRKLAARHMKNGIDLLETGFVAQIG